MTRVLIADDNKANLYLLESVLKGNGFSVDQAANGEEALALATKDPPDLIISDILMPKMDGFELCRRWKTDRRLQKIPFIFYTATYTDPRDEKFALDLGAERFLIKPLKPDVLMMEIRTVLSGASDAGPSPASRPLGDEMEILRQYNEVLFRKLEKKVLQLEDEIEERKTAQQQTEAAVKELEQKNAELARFTYTVSHELRTPLITIQGFAGLIDEEISAGKDPAGLKNHVGRIMKAVSILDALLSDLQKLSRTGKSINTPEPVDFGIIAEEAADLFSHALAERGMQISIDPDFPVVRVDRTRVREVLVNLIENAIKYRGSRENPAIWIGADCTGKDPVFFVRDNGIGIDPRYLERVFSLFEKLDGSSEGTGIGLAIARKVIEAHGGRIWAESGGAGKGTTFRFTLPVVHNRHTDTNNNGQRPE